MPAMKSMFQGSFWRRFIASSNVRSGFVRPYFLSESFETAQVLSNFFQRSFSRKLGGAWNAL